MRIEGDDGQRLIALWLGGCWNGRPNQAVGIVLDVLDSDLAQLVGQQLAEHKLPLRAGIRARALDRRRVDLHVAKEAAEQAGVVDHYPWSVVRYQLNRASRSLQQPLDY